MAQTLEQRKRNAKFAKDQADRRGKPASELKKKDTVQKSPISPTWLIVFGFIVFGGLVFEVLARIFGR